MSNTRHRTIKRLLQKYMAALCIPRVEKHCKELREMCGDGALILGSRERTQEEKKWLMSITPGGRGWVGCVHGQRI